MSDVVTALLDENAGILGLISDSSKDPITDHNQTDNGNYKHTKSASNGRVVYYATFGHSMGAWVSYAMCQELMRRKSESPHLLPLAMFVSGNRAPHLFGKKNDVHPYDMHRIGEDATSDKEALEQFWSAMAERYGQSKMSDGIKRIMTPLLKADFEVVETYDPTINTAKAAPVCKITMEADESGKQETSVLSKISKLPFHLVAIGAVDDIRYTPDQVHAWIHHTDNPESFSEEWVGGGHSYITEENPREILLLIRTHLARVLPSH